MRFIFFFILINRYDFLDIKFKLFVINKKKFNNIICFFCNIYFNFILL